MTHYAVLWMFGNYYGSYKPGAVQLAFIIITGLILLVGAAYLIMVVYDIPVRKYLSDKRNERLAKQKAGSV
jgi:peptidoglycan/LPS O-acetylase OafA/YrhL